MFLDKSVNVINLNSRNVTVLTVRRVKENVWPLYLFHTSVLSCSQCCGMGNTSETALSGLVDGPSSLGIILSGDQTHFPCLTALSLQKWGKCDCNNPGQNRDATSKVPAAKRSHFAATATTEFGHTRRRIKGLPVPHKEMCHCGLCA